MNKIELNNFIVAAFQLLLDDLQVSKIQDDDDKNQLIAVLTMSAQEDIGCCEDIVDVIREQLKIVSHESRILILSLIESIILFVGGEYTNLFKKYIDEIFADATDDVDENVESHLTQFLVHFNLIFPPKLSDIIPTSPDNKINEMLENISFWMNTQYNSLQNVQHYSEIVL